MNKKFLIGLVTIVFIGVIGFFVYPKLFPQKPERKILYWTDPMIPGDRSDRPGKSPMGMDRVPVYEDENKQANTATNSSEEEAYYTCPMHLSVHKDKPGACPVCGMALVKKVKASSVSTEKTTLSNDVTLSPSKQVLANVSTTTAERMRLWKKIVAVGKIDYAEPNFRHISTRFPGRLEKLHLTYTGQSVKKGDPVADVYSPEAISAQQEYLLAKDSYDQVKDSPELISSGALSLLEQSKQKLMLWGITEQQIAELERTKKVNTLITIHSPISGIVLKKNVDPQHYAMAGEDIYDVADLSTVWMYADVYEYEVQSLKVGERIVASTEAYPGEQFVGRITFISPTVDASARTVRVRAEFPNPHEKLKPEMFVSATIKIQLSMTVAVPATAVLSMGQRHVVWVEKSEGIYEPRKVLLGVKTEDYYQILDGIDEGDIVVISGGYLLDSESQLQTPDASEQTTMTSEHQH